MSISVIYSVAEYMSTVYLSCRRLSENILAFSQSHPKEKQNFSPKKREREGKKQIYTVDPNFVNTKAYNMIWYPRVFVLYMLYVKKKPDNTRLNYVAPQIEVLLLRVSLFQNTLLNAPWF